MKACLLVNIQGKNKAKYTWEFSAIISNDVGRAWVQREERKSAPRLWMDTGKPPGENVGLQGGVILEVNRNGFQFWHSLANFDY